MRTASSTARIAAQLGAFIRVEPVVRVQNPPLRKRLHSEKFMRFHRKKSLTQSNFRWKIPRPYREHICFLADPCRPTQKEKRWMQCIVQVYLILYVDD